MSKPRHTGVCLPPELFRRLDDEAARQTRSRNNLIRVLLVEGLDRLDAERTAREALTEAAAAPVTADG